MYKLKDIKPYLDENAILKGNKNVKFNNIQTSKNVNQYTL